MTIKASGRAALIIAAGIWACCSGPLQAAGSADRDGSAVSKPASTAGAPISLKKYPKSHHVKKFAQRKSDKTGLKSATARKAADAADDTGDNSTAMPASVANANAQFASADSPTGSAKAMSARASTILQAAAADNDTAPAADSQVVAADQLNDLDRALQETKPPARPITLASAEVPAAAPAAPVMASSSSDNSTWDQTSLIGKIFIAFGGLLTLASAARMFMA